MKSRFMTMRVTLLFSCCVTCCLSCSTPRLHESKSFPQSAFAQVLAPPSRFQRDSAAATATTTLLGNQWSTGWPSQRVSNSGNIAVFRPTANNIPRLHEMAFATYQFNISDLKHSTLGDNVYLQWRYNPYEYEETFDPLPNRSWLALANYQLDRWDWQRLSDPWSPTVENWDPYIGADNRVSLVVAVESSHEVQLMRIAIELKGSPADDWAMYGHDARHSNRSSYVGPNDPMENWAFITNGDITSRPCIAQDGTLYVGSKDGQLYAINSDGTPRWSVPIYTSCSPAIDTNGIIYSRGSDGFLMAVKPNGELMWSNPLQIVHDYTSPVLSGNATVIAGGEGGVICVKTNGHLEWRITSNAYQAGSVPAIGEDDTVYSAPYAGGVIAQSVSGDHKWTYRNDLNFAGPAVISIGNDGTILVAEHNTQSVHGIRADGTKRWSYTLASPMTNSSGFAIDGNNNIYFGDMGGHMYSISSEGDENWIYTLSGKVQCPMVDNNNNVYFGSTNKYIYSLDSAGNLRWQHLLPDSTESSPVLSSDGTLYIGCNDGKLYALSDTGS